MNLKVDTRSVGEGIAVIALTGEADVYTSPRVKQVIGELLDQGARLVVINLEAVEFMDSTALGSLLWSLRRARERNAGFRLVCSNRRVLRILEMTGLAGIFEVHPSDAAALESAPV